MNVVVNVQQSFTKGMLEIFFCLGRKSLFSPCKKQKQKAVTIHEKQNFLITVLIIGFEGIKEDHVRPCSFEYRLLYEFEFEINLSRTNALLIPNDFGMELSFLILQLKE